MYRCRLNTTQNTLQNNRRRPNSPHLIPFAPSSHHIQCELTNTLPIEAKEHDSENLIPFNR